MSWFEGFVSQVRDPATDIIVACRDKAAPLAVKCMSYGEGGVADIAVLGEGWGI